MGLKLLLKIKKTNWKCPKLSKTESSFVATNMARHVPNYPQKHLVSCLKLSLRKHTFFVFFLQQIGLTDLKKNKKSNKQTKNWKCLILSAKRTQFCNYKHGWTCPKLSLKTPALVGLKQWSPAVCCLAAILAYICNLIYIIHMKHMNITYSWCAET